MKEIVRLTFEKEMESLPEPGGISLVYVLKGKLPVQYKGEKYLLSAGDFLMVNPQDAFMPERNESLSAVFSIDERGLLKETSYQRRYFMCNTAGEENDSYADTKVILDRLITASFEEEFRDLNVSRYSAELVLNLVTHYSNNSYYEMERASRKNEIEAYLQARYTDDISLEETAAYFHFTPQYFSHLFKSLFGDTFLHVLTDMRLEEAHKDVTGTDRKILNIALDQGFRSMASFETAFKRKYGMTPGEYRKKCRTDEKESLVEADEILDAVKRGSQEEETEMKTVTVDLRKESSPLDRFWFRMCNLGNVSDLIRMNRHEMEEVLQGFGIEQGRVTLDRDVETEDIEDEIRIFDLLVEMNMRPVLAVEYRRIQDEDVFLSLLSRLTNAAMNRYGSERQWMLELVYDSRFTKESAGKYCALTRKVHDLIEEKHCGVTLAGPCLSMDRTGKNLEVLLQAEPAVDVLTIRAVPYAVEENDEGSFIHRLSDEGYILRQVHTAEKVMRDLHVEKNLLITEWKALMADKHMVYDSEFRGADIIRNVLACFGEVDCLPMEIPFDALVEKSRGFQALHGLPGLLTERGVRKPAYYAYRFLKQTDRNYVTHTDHVLISAADPGYLQVITHNCRKLNYRFYNSEMSGSGGELSSYFEDEEPLTMKLIFTGIPDGNYFIKTRLINEESGSAVRILENMHYGDEVYFGRDEREYLDALSKPRMEGSEAKAENGTLILSCTLGPNEIRHVHILPKKQ